MTGEYSRYYKVLELTPEATPEDVKKAYFRLVRVHSPEKDPEKFQEIRQAYEVLKDGAPKTEAISFPVPDNPSVAFLLNIAYQQMSNGNYKAAVKYVEEALEYEKNSPYLLLLLSRLERRAGTPRKSAATAKKLQNVAPDCAEAYALAAVGYYVSDWHKKSYPEFKKAWELGYRELGFIIDYADSAEANGDKTLAERLRSELFKNTKWDKKNISEAAYIYGRRFRSCKAETELRELLDEYEQFLLANRRIVRTPGMGEELTAPFVTLGLDGHDLLRNPSVYKRIDDMIRNMGSYTADFDEKVIINARNEVLLNAITANSDFSIDWYHIAVSTIFEDMADRKLIRYEVLDSLLCMMKERDKNAAILPTVKEYYPLLYDMVGDDIGVLTSDKFDEDFKRLKNEFAQLNKKYEGSMFLERYPEEITIEGGKVFYSKDEPYVRASKKIGRNDPCPCGSGKKFKKCCGRNMV